MIYLIFQVVQLIIPRARFTLYFGKISRYDADI
jgi:hypothetical protein